MGVVTSRSRSVSCSWPRSACRDAEPGQPVWLWVAMTGPSRPLSSPYAAGRRATTPVAAFPASCCGAAAVLLAIRHVGVSLLPALSRPRPLQTYAAAWPCPMALPLPDRAWDQADAVAIAVWLSWHSSRRSIHLPAESLSAMAIL